MSNEKNDENLTDTEIVRAISKEAELNKLRSQNIPSFKYEFGSCKICEDNSTGIHFGVATCEACKGFFKRSLHKNKHYRCDNSGQCKIIAKKTKKCKYCRWIKCLKMGMSFNKVRKGRIPDSLKELKPKSQDSIKQEKLDYDLEQSEWQDLKERNENETISNNSQLDLFKTYLPKTFRFENILKNSNSNKLAVLSMLKDKTYQIYIENTKEFEYSKKRARELIETGSQSPKYDCTPQFIKLLREKYYLYLKRNAYSLMNIVKELPGFQRLPSEDINIILNSNFFLLLGLRVYKLYINNEWYVMIDDNIQMSRELCKSFFGEEVNELMFRSTKRFTDIGLSEGELALMAPFYLSTLVDNAESTDILSELNEYYRHALFNEFKINNRSEEFIENLIDVLKLMLKINKTFLNITFDPETNQVKF